MTEGIILGPATNHSNVLSWDDNSALFISYDILDITMDDDKDRLESIDLKPSRVSEQTLINLGAILHHSLMQATLLHEVELTRGVIVEFCSMWSSYADKTERMPEDVYVDLNEASLFKRDKIAAGEDISGGLWLENAEDFIEYLTSVAEDMEIKLPIFD